MTATKEQPNQRQNQSQQEEVGISFALYPFVLCLTFRVISREVPLGVAFGNLAHMTREQCVVLVSCANALTISSA